MPKTAAPAPLYRHIVADAWRMSWEHKHLWIFGFFATFIGFGGVYEMLFKAYRDQADLVPALSLLKSPLDLIPGFMSVRTIVAYSPSPAVASLIFLVIAGLFLAVFAWMTVMSVGALIASARKISRGGHPDFSDGVKAGTEPFWRLLAIIALAKFVALAGFVLTGTNLFYLSTARTGMSALLFIMSFVVMTAVAVVTALLAVYASCYAVIKGTDIRASILNSWKLLSTHWLMSVEMILVLMLVDLAVGIAAVLALLVLSVPVVFLFLLGIAVKSRLVVMGLMAVGGAAILLVAAALGSFLTTIKVSGWALLWSELTEGAP
ncbi:MAG: hypothetical protein AAB692_01565, partial [Patescibacteria group bacterium]